MNLCKAPKSVKCDHRRNLRPRTTDPGCVYEDECVFKEVRVNG